MADPDFEIGDIEALERYLTGKFDDAKQRLVALNSTPLPQPTGPRAGERGEAMIRAVNESRLAATEEVVSAALMYHTLQALKR